jgi:ABC-type transporter Mla maintaining outer membrane lipid asymmetry permease subunit MlaE
MIDQHLYLMFPRLIGVTVSIFCLSVIFNIATLLTGYISSIMFVYFPFDNFISQILEAISLTDMIVWILKINLFGIIISIVSFHQGINVEPTPRDVPRVATRGFINSMIICLVVDALISSVVIGFL